MTVRLTDRDMRMLVKCAVCRWLTTDQIRRLYFADATLNAVQKRLRKLADAGYLRSHREHPTAESIHSVGAKGKPLVEEKGLEVVMGDVPGPPEHLVGVNELRLAVEVAALPVAYCFAYWELGDAGWRHSVIPDLVFAVRQPELRAFVAEYDRGTETIGKLLDKVRQYAAGLEGFPFEAVLLVTEEVRRLDSLARAMQKDDLAVGLLISSLGEVQETGIFSTEFVEIPGGIKRKILATQADSGLLSGSPFEVRGETE